MAENHPYGDWLGKQVVLDVAPPLIYIGRLAAVDGFFLTLEEADVHELRGSTSKEVYLMEARRNGVQPNRRLARVKKSEVISVSLLDDVILY